MRLLDLRQWILDDPSTWMLSSTWVASTAADASRSRPAIEYAVLSHTWESDGDISLEVTFQELELLGKNNDTNATAMIKCKSGYDKIIKTCLLAKRDKLNYVWIDTCCINKDSSSELSEAINSMWKWYYGATVCYVFLSDVHGTDTVLSDLEDFESIEDYTLHSRTSHIGQRALANEFGASRYFRRGWTLQELIAPSHVVFYAPDQDGHWKYIGTKHELITLLWQITGIDPLALQDHSSMPVFVAARKFAWAAGRETSIIEDRAYSLMGILGVNMSLLYGEGTQSFVRLQEQLLRTSTDHSVLAWEPRRSQPSQPGDLIFASSPDQFFPAGKRMIRWGNSSDHQAFQLTNRGLDFEGIALTKDQTHILLNCCFEDDPRGTIALPVQRDMLAPKDVRDRMLFRTFDTDMGTSQHHLEVLYIHNVILKKITLLRHPPAPFPDSAVWRPPGVVLLGNPTIAIIAAWPKNVWNKNTMVVHLPFQRTYPETMFVSAMVQSQASRRLAMIAVKFNTTETKAVKHNNPYFVRVAILSVDSRIACFESTVGGQLTEELVQSNSELELLRAELLQGLRDDRDSNKTVDHQDHDVAFKTKDSNDSSITARVVRPFRKPGGMMCCVEISNL